MAIRFRTVEVKQLPETLNRRQAQVFLEELKAAMSVDRPRLVLDCTHLRSLDPSGAYLLLSLLEEALKRNGDIKLAAVPPHVEALLQSCGLGRIFETFTTTDEAVDSFHPQIISRATVTGQGSAAQAESAA